MVFLVVTRIGNGLDILCRFLFFLAFLLNSWRKLQLYLSVQCSQLRFQAFQLLLFLPCLACDFLKLRYLFLQSLASGLVLLNVAWYLL